MIIENRDQLDAALDSFREALLILDHTGPLAKDVRKGILNALFPDDKKLKVLQGALNYMEVDGLDGPSFSPEATELVTELLEKAITEEKTRLGL